MHGVGGDSSLRCVHLAFLAATRTNPPVRVFYRRLVAAGKRPEVALSACIGKLLALCNALCQHQTAWDPSMAEPLTPRHSCFSVSEEDAGTPDQVRGRHCVFPHER